MTAAMALAASQQLQQAQISMLARAMDPNWCWLVGNSTISTQKMQCSACVCMAWTACRPSTCPAQHLQRSHDSWLEALA